MDLLAMARIAIIMLVLAASYDYIQLNGRFTAVAVRTVTSILQHFGLQ